MTKKLHKLTREAINKYMNYFSVKNEQTCLQELDECNQYVKDTFKAEVSLDALEKQIFELIEAKIQDYYIQRFKDWSVANLLIMHKVIQQKIEEEKKPAARK